MKTVKEILTENRDSVISSIKFTFKVWKNEDVKVKMIKFLAYAEKNMNVAAFENSKRVKTDLKNLVIHMSIEQRTAKEDAYNMSHFGTTRPKLRDIMGAIAERYENQGLVWNPLQKDWVKNTGFNARLAK